MRFAEPAWLILLLLAPLPWFWERARPRMTWPSLASFASAPRARAGWPRLVSPLLRFLALAFLAIALARPQTVGGQVRNAARGVAIVAALDQSTSMTVADFPSPTGTNLTRLEAAKKTFEQFVLRRPDDLIGLVAFANYPDHTCPPTLDHQFLLNSVRSLRSAKVGDDGTNLGDALVWSLDALRRVSPKKKVLILLTDGQNQPAVPKPADPEKAAVLARRFGITLHTIAIGKGGGIVRERDPTTGLEIPAEVKGPDFALLRRLAEIGEGRAFEATDARSLDEVFHAIDALEKSPVQATFQTRYREWYAPWVAAALAMLVLDRLLSGGPLRRLP